MFLESERDSLYKRQKGKCNYCGVKLGICYMYVHKFTAARDSYDRLDTLQMLCPWCNDRKGTAPDEEFREHYELTPAKQARGGPPANLIPQGYFEEISKTK